MSRIASSVAAAPANHKRGVPHRFGALFGTGVACGGGGGSSGGGGGGGGGATGTTIGLYEYTVSGTTAGGVSATVWFNVE